MLMSLSATQKAKTTFKYFFIIFLNITPPDVIKTFYYFTTASDFALGCREITITYTVSYDTIENNYVVAYTCFLQLSVFVHRDLLNSALSIIEEFTEKQTHSSQARLTP